MRKHGKAMWRGLIHVITASEERSPFEKIGGAVMVIGVLAVCAWGPCG